MPGMFNFTSLNGNLELLQPSECFVVLAHDLHPSRMKLRQFPQLMGTDRSLYVGHIVLESRSDHLVIPGTPRAILLPRIAAHPVQTPDPCLIHQFAQSREHATFSSRQIFCCIEREAGENRNGSTERKRTDAPILVFCRKAMGSVFNNCELVFGSDFKQRFQFTR